MCCTFTTFCAKQTYTINEGNVPSDKGIAFQNKRSPGSSSRSSQIVSNALCKLHGAEQRSACSSSLRLLPALCRLLRAASSPFSSAERPFYATQRTIASRFGEETPYRLCLPLLFSISALPDLWNNEVSSDEGPAVAPLTACNVYHARIDNSTKSGFTSRVSILTKVEEVLWTPTLMRGYSWSR